MDNGLDSILISIGYLTTGRQKWYKDELDAIYSIAVDAIGHDVPAWKVTGPKWDGIGQLLYGVNMVWRGIDDGWRIIAQTALALKELN